MSRHNFSRRGFLRGAAVAAGAALGSRIAGKEGIEGLARADAAAEKSALLCVYLPGGYNALFSSSDSFNGTGFGTTDGNNLGLGGDGNLVVDKVFQSMPQLVLQNMATVGNRHGSSDHGNAQALNWSDGKTPFALQLAAAMGGDASIKAAAIGGMPFGPKTAQGGVSYQLITDMDSTIRALGGGPADPKVPGRDVAAAALTRAQGMSGGSISSNPNSAVQFRDGYSTVIDTLKKPVKPFKFADVAAPYYGGTAPSSTAIGTDFKSKIVGAELMLRAGANVVTIMDNANNGDVPWDSHGDSNGSRVRQMMTQRILPGLNIFLQRMTTDATLMGMNIVVTIFGDFARSRPNSDHASGVSPTVIGKYVKLGTAGKMDANVGLSPNTGGPAAYWGYLAQALRVPQAPFGTPMYTNLIKTTKGWG